MECPGATWVKMDRITKGTKWSKIRQAYRREKGITIQNRPYSPFMGSNFELETLTDKKRMEKGKRGMGNDALKEHEKPNWFLSIKKK